MTKTLSQLLDVGELDFHQMLMKLERASGKGSLDIRLTSELLAGSRSKLAELGLDPKDTTGPELYEMLNQKMAASDKELAKVLKLEPLEPDFLYDFTASIKKLVAASDCFALKASVAKKLLRANTPKKAMKALGYRSLDSYLKHESLAGLYASAKISESSAWHESFIASYKKLTPSDFESRPVSIIALTSDRWQKLAADYADNNRHNILELREISTLAILPLESYRPGMITAMFLLALAAANDMVATSSYLKLHQVKADFGKIVASTASEHPAITNPLDDRKMSWRTVYDFIANSSSNLEPQLVGNSSVLAQPADVLASLSPMLEFWHGTSHLAHLHNGKATSLNPTDAAINFVNKFPFEERVNIHFRANLWRKLWQGYLQTEILGEKLLAGLKTELAGSELAPELIPSESQF